MGNTNDVIVVGAGPGGSTAAIGLARRGVRDVLVLDRDEFPRDKTCGSGLSPNAIALADELGLGDELRRRSVPMLSVKIVTPGGRSMVLAGNAAAVILLRRDFDDMLLRRAESLGARFQGGVKVISLLRENTRVVGVRLADGTERRARYVICADGAHSIFSMDPRPKRSISTLMGWWEDVDVVYGQAEMIFDECVSPLYGWLFPESATRVNIGVCIEGQDKNGEKTKRNVRDVFATFLDRHYRDRLKNARQVGPLKGHPIAYTTWVSHCTAPGALFLGEAARVTHNATGEGISQAMQSGLYAADTIASVLSGAVGEEEAMRTYTWRHRKRFTAGFLAGHALRAVVKTPLLDVVADVSNHPFVRSKLVRILGSALAGSEVHAAAE
ncbi:putative electron transfer oxidoreductase [Labilithrix luteola]|uniref:Putative electron transfer oxidoreductase n=1 Tax=Labilithrix luteola TaxID=1391654 RepID=A0A0K1PK85_9BACT|nr:NAD(P)/FAD-dependent oxidoreductase [Labilithrix luteola]AKU93953.1 putative electron transfer oxidoreductase [Labilithrix luteola]